MAVVSFAANIATLKGPICGQHLCGTFVVNGTSEGPMSKVHAQPNLIRGFAPQISGKGVVTGNFKPSTPLQGGVAGKATISPDLRSSLPFAAVIAGKTKATVALGIRFDLHADIQGDATVNPTLNLKMAIIPFIVGRGVVVVVMFPVWFPSEEEELGWVPSHEDNLTWIPTIH
jgi:hypothetical protein